VGVDFEGDFGLSPVCAGDKPLALGREQNMRIAFRTLALLAGGTPLAYGCIANHASNDAAFDANESVVDRNTRESAVIAGFLTPDVSPAAPGPFSRQLLFAVFPDGRAVYAANQIDGDAPFTETHLSQKQVSTLRDRCDADFKDLQDAPSQTGPDSSFITFAFRASPDHPPMYLASWHELAGRGLVVTDLGIESRDGRSDAEIRRGWSRQYTRFRTAWDDVRQCMAQIATSGTQSRQVDDPGATIGVPQMDKDAAPARSIADSLLISKAISVEMREFGGFAGSTVQLIQVTNEPGWDIRRAWTIGAEPAPAVAPTVLIVSEAAARRIADYLDRQGLARQAARDPNTSGLQDGFYTTIDVRCGYTEYHSSSITPDPKSSGLYSVMKHVMQLADQKNDGGASDVR
jgi:hypothetical protein